MSPVCPRSYGSSPSAEHSRRQARAGLNRTSMSSDRLAGIANSSSARPLRPPPALRKIRATAPAYRQVAGWAQTAISTAASCGQRPPDHRFPPAAKIAVGVNLLLTMFRQLASCTGSEGPTCLGKLR